MYNSHVSHKICNLYKSKNIFCKDCYLKSRNINFSEGNLHIYFRIQSCLFIQATAVISRLISVITIFIHFLKFRRRADLTNLFKIWLWCKIKLLMFWQYHQIFNTWIGPKACFTKFRYFFGLMHMNVCERKVISSCIYVSVFRFTRVAFIYLLK